MLGGQQELDAWVNQTTLSYNGPPSAQSIAGKQLSMHTSRYIVYDFEADASTNTHELDHFEVDILRGNDCYEYDKCLLYTHSFDGYNTLDRFCDWLFTDKSHCNSTVLAHNGSGYDFRFVLKYGLERGLHPDVFIRSGYIILYMWFQKIILDVLIHYTLSATFSGFI